jgi:glucokinase
VEAHAIAVDLGGTGLRAARIDRFGNILDRLEVATKAQAGADAVLEQISELVDSIIKNASDARILGVGVCAPGPLDTKRGIALSIPTINGFDNYPLLAKLQECLALPVVLENDAIAAAVGEWKFGAGLGSENIVYVTVSTGIGGGIIADGKVLRGRQGMAGHIGHMIVVPDGELCNCGCRGCFEAYGSGPAFAARAKIRANQGNQTLLGKNNAKIDCPAIFAAAKAKDPLAIELVREEAEILGRGFTSLAHLFSPDLIVMGGGLANEFDCLIPAILKNFRANSMKAFQNIPIRCSILGGSSGLIGASSLLFEQFHTPK